MQNHIAAGDYRLFFSEKSENVNIFGGTDKSVPYGVNEGFCKLNFNCGYRLS